MVESDLTPGSDPAPESDLPPESGRAPESGPESALVSAAGVPSGRPPESEDGDVSGREAPPSEEGRASGEEFGSEEWCESAEGDESGDAEGECCGVEEEEESEPCEESAEESDGASPPLCDSRYPASNGVSRSVDEESVCEGPDWAPPSGECPPPAAELS